MPTNYFPTSTSYPALIEPILERIRLYICTEVLYTTEAYATSKTSRFIFADISNNAFRVASKITKATNFSLPITVYSIGELETDMSKLAPNAFLKITYDDTYNAVINSMPSVFTIPMMSIFNTGHDYMEAWTKFQIGDLKKTLLEVPIVLNGVTTTFPILVDFDPQPVKGMYAFELEQQLGVGRINCIQHDLKIYFHNLVLDGDGIHPVDDMQVALFSYANTDYRDCKDGGSGLVATTPSVSYTIPVDDAISYPVQSGIVIAFNIAMNEDMTNDNLYIDPYTWYEVVWNSTSKTVTITPNENLTSGTVYTVTVYEEATSGDGIEMEADHTISFTTI